MAGDCLKIPPSSHVTKFRILPTDWKISFVLFFWIKYLLFYLLGLRCFLFFFSPLFLISTWVLVDKAVISTYSYLFQLIHQFFEKTKSYCDFCPSSPTSPLGLMSVFLNKLFSLLFFPLGIYGCCSLHVSVICTFPTFLLVICKSYWIQKKCSASLHSAILFSKRSSWPRLISPGFLP